jgi:hypothetical protein
MRRTFGIFVGLLFLAGEIPSFAQIGGPGQYPPGQYPPGRYPPGRYPGGGGVGIPGRGKQKKTKEKDTPEALKDVTGLLRKMDEALIVVEAPDARILSLKRSAKTKFFKNADPMKPSDLKAGDHLRIEASQDEEGFLYAANVILEKEGTAAERANASQPVEVIMPASSNNDDDRPVLRRKDAPAPAPEIAKAQPSAPASAASVEESDAAPPVKATQAAPAPAPRDQEDPGPPKLQRGRPAPRKRANDEPVQVATNTAREPEPRAGRPAVVPPPEPKEPEAIAKADPVIEKARAVAGSFTETLPNYIVQEFMARFVNASNVVNWKPEDVVSAEVIYENGKESYRNLAINGKPVKKRMEELSGAWSTGEFGTLLVDLFSPSTAADFRFRKESTSGGKAALVYNFDVVQEHSHWHVQSASQGYNPAYKGSVWIEKQTYRVLRIEMQAYRFPEEFPLDKVESATDYEYVRFADRQFLMPVHAETLSCQRGTSLCSMNKIDFRNYHKYSGEATITFEK